MLITLQKNIHQNTHYKAIFVYFLAREQQTDGKLQLSLPKFKRFNYSLTPFLILSGWLYNDSQWVMTQNTTNNKTTQPNKTGKHNASIHEHLSTVVRRWTSLHWNLNGSPSHRTGGLKGKPLPLITCLLTGLTTLHQSWRIPARVAPRCLLHSQLALLVSSGLLLLGKASDGKVIHHLLDLFHVVLEAVVTLAQRVVF